MDRGSGNPCSEVREQGRVGQGEGRDGNEEGGKDGEIEGRRVGGGEGGGGRAIKGENSRSWDEKVGGVERGEEKKGEGGEW